VTGTILTRAVVPLWVLTGAIFKLIEDDARLLPKHAVLKPADALGIDLSVLMALLVSVEFVAVAIMLLLPRLARPTAIFMLLVFCLVLIVEMLNGASNCGCLGASSPPPWVMLLIDGSLLAGVLACVPRPATTAPMAIPAASIASLGAIAMSFSMLAGNTAADPVPPPPGPGAEGTQAPNDGTSGASRTADADSGRTTGEAPDRPVNPGGESSDGSPSAPSPPSAPPLPKHWFVADIDAWVGTPYEKIDLFGFVASLPADLAQGTHYVVFYGRTCDHCESMFNEDLASDDELASKVLAIEVPVDTNIMRREDEAWPMPQTKCRHLALPLGPNWVITTPMTVRIENGVITCAQEGDHRACMGLE